MATSERPQVPVCDWCRAAMHNKCERLKRLHGICACDCERGY